MSGNAVSALEKEAWPGKLQASLEILRGFNQQSEGGFLKLGETLREVAGLARRLAECASELAGAGGVMRYREAVGEFEALSRELGAIRRGTERHGEVIERIAGLARAFRGPALEFARANRTFRLLGLYVRVEASRLRGEGGEFASLADDIAALASGIDESAGNLERDSRRAAGELQSGRTMLRELGLEQTAESGKILDSAAEEIHALSGRAGLAEGAARVLAEGCGRLRDEVARIVNSLQFQDIARQRLEHVCEGVERLLEGLRRDEGGPGALSLVALEARQLDSAREELKAALERIGESLESAGTQSAGFGAEAARLSAERLDLKSCGETMTGAAAGCVASLERLEQVVAGVMPVLDDMGLSASRIDETGYRIGLVSLNCAVKTARLGNEGAALGVVAAEMGRLAMESGAQAAAAMQRLEELRSQTALLADLGQGHGGQGLQERVNGAMEKAERAEEGCAERLGSIQQLAERLTAEIGGAVRRRAWERPLLAGLEEAAGLLREVEGGLESAGGEGAAHEGEWFRGLEGRYTMASEREIHREYVAADTPQESLTGAKTDETFGDGIELF